MELWWLIWADVSEMHPQPPPQLRPLMWVEGELPQYTIMMVRKNTVLESLLGSKHRAWQLCLHSLCRGHT